MSCETVLGSPGHAFVSCTPPESVSRSEQDSFPIQAICGAVWKNGEGQLSFLRHAVSAPPDVFTFSHSPRKQVCPTLSVHDLSLNPNSSFKCNVLMWKVFVSSCSHHLRACQGKGCLTVLPTMRGCLSTYWRCSVSWLNRVMRRVCARCWSIR